MSRQLGTTFQMSGETKRIVEYMLIVGTWRWPAVLLALEIFGKVSRPDSSCIGYEKTMTTICSFPINLGHRNVTPQQHGCAWITAPFPFYATCSKYSWIPASSLKILCCERATWMIGHCWNLHFNVLCYTKLVKYSFQTCKDILQCWCILLTRLKTHYLIFYSFLQSSSSELKHKEK